MKLSPRIWKALVATLLVQPGAWGVAGAQTSAGSQLLQIPPQRTESSPAQADVRIDTTTSPTPRTDTSKVVVANIQFSGVTVVPVSDLIKRSGFVPGQSYTLGELRELAARVTSHYRSLGFFLAQTFVRPQDITDGVVEFTVVEGKYDTIKLSNQSRLSDAVASKLLVSLQDAGAVTAAELERRLLILSDLPGVNAKSVLTPGTKLGTTDLTVQLSESQRAGGKLDYDNHGNTYTGANRVGATMFINEPTGLGDLATARVLTAGESLSYGQALYQVQVGWASVGMSLAAMTYRLYGDFASLQSSGSARVQNIFLSYPLIRSRGKNLNVQVSSDRKEFSDLTAPSGVSTKAEKVSQLTSVTLRGDIGDSSGQASNEYALTWSHGEINLNDLSARNLDSISAQSQGGFDKASFSFARQQAISNTTQLYAGVNGQWASKNLDASEKFSLGGAGNVRAFPSGEAAGDEGLVLTLEARTNLPLPTERLQGKLRLITFLDSGMVHVNKNRWGADTVANQRTLSGGGLGLSYVGVDKWVINAYYALKFGNEVAKSQTDAPGRFWFQITKSF